MGCPACALPTRSVYAPFAHFNKTWRHTRRHPMFVVVRRALLLCAVLAAATVQAQDKQVTLKLSSWVPMQHPLNPALQAWAEDIKKESNGTIVSTLFPSEQLGKAFDHYDMARDGIADAAYVNP